MQQHDDVLGKIYHRRSTVTEKLLRRYGELDNYYFVNEAIFTIMILNI